VLSEQGVTRREEAGVVAEQGGGTGDLVRDEDDHDLLTFSESGIRLREEVAAAQAALREHPTEERRAELEARLQTLTDALVRNTRQASAKPGEKGFLDYAPPRPADADAERES
jgi:hypothetical protein